MPTAQEIQEKLRELNRASLVSERQKKLEWFRENKIETILIETIHYLAPQKVSRFELNQHIIELNRGLRIVREQLSWMKEHHQVVKMEKTEYGERYVYVGERKGEKEKEEHSQTGEVNSGAQNTQTAKGNLIGKKNSGEAVSNE